MAQEAPREDLAEHYRLETFFGEASVSHTIYSPFTHIEEWRRVEEIGGGGFGTVHLEQGPKGCVRAVKVIDKTFSAGIDLSRELSIMSFLTKHRVSLFVQFLGWFENSEKLYIAMEYFEKGDLRRHLGEQMPVPTAKLLARQLLEGLNVMHMNGIAHRDIKPENIFVVSLSPLRVKLGDFGISKCINEHTMLCTQVFTRSYAAPEILGALESSLETSEYTHAVDIWSLGCVMFEVLTGSALFQKDLSVWHFCYGKAGAMLEPLREAVREEGGFEFVRGLLSPDPGERPSAAKALSDPWLKVPEITKAREAGGMHAYAAAEPQTRTSELLPPILETPESSLETSDRSCTVDVWALGCMMCKILRDSRLKVSGIRKAREEGRTVPYAVESQTLIRELLPPISPGLLLGALSSIETPENPLIGYLGSSNNGGGGQGSAIHSADDDAVGVHEFHYAMHAHGRNFNGELIKHPPPPPPPPLTQSSKRRLVFCLKGLIALASILSVRPKYNQGKPGGAAGDPVDSLFASALGLWLIHEAFRLTFRPLLPQQKPLAAGGKGGDSRFADLSTLDALVFYFLMAALRGVGRSGVWTYAGGRSG